MSTLELQQSSNDFLSSTAKPDFSDLNIVDCTLHTHCAFGQRVDFDFDDGRKCDGIVVDMFRTNKRSAYKVLLNDFRTIWITGESINRLRGMTTIDYTRYLSSVIAMPVICQTYVNVWYNVPVFENGEIEATAIDIEGDSVLVYVEGWNDFVRFPRKDTELDELALGTEYDEWLDSLEDVA